MNTEKENGGKIYLVSFGNSDKYLLHDNSAGEKSELARIESELNAFLRKKFPDETFAYFTTPRVTEISPAHASQYSDCALLDTRALESIKKVLAREVEDMEAARRLNDNAPFANVDSSAAGLPHPI